MHRMIVFCGAALLCAALSGCANSRPFWSAPGPIRQQQSNASLHDPYADNVAGPAVVGSRPREFQDPLAEPVRSRPTRDGWTAR